MTYDEFINSILATRGRFGITDGYKERHHIIPICLNGSNDKDNLIDLTASEHFIAHYLLAKENPNNVKLQIAIWAMLNWDYTGDRQQIKVEVDSKIYEEARILAAKGSSNLERTEEWKQKISNSLKGRPKSDYAKQCVSLSNKRRTGQNHPMYGKKYSAEWCKHISESLKGKYTGENSAMWGKHLSEEAKEKIRVKALINFKGEGNPMYRKKGEDNPNYGKRWYNNGEKEIKSFNCPEGYVKGRLKRKS